MSAATFRAAILEARGASPGRSGAWVVRGQRVESDGTTRIYLSTSFGATEERARQAHRALQQMGVRQGRYAPAELWSDEDLTFTPAEDDCRE